MIPFQAGRESDFQIYDPLLFGDRLADEVIRLLSIPAMVSFWSRDATLCRCHSLSREQEEILQGEREGGVAEVLDSMLVIPLAAEGGRVDVVVHDVDPALLRKMAPEWLQELKGEIEQRFSLLRKGFTDPGSGLYNQRALAPALSGQSCWKSLFLIATVSRRRSISGGYQKISQLASLLECTIKDPLYYFGQGLFGCVRRSCDRREALDFSHRLIARLKREGLHRVHVGFSCLEEGQSAEQTLTDCWLALVEAERRGPYSLCDASLLQGRDQHPLSLPPARLLRILKRRWYGLPRFGLALFSSSGKGRLPELQPFLPDDAVSVSVSDGEQLVLLPGVTGPGTAKLVRRLAGEIEAASSFRPAVGFTHWPMADYGKVDCVRNCRKAILHGTFYGSGAVVEFDALSMNVSGDLYFDEGDYQRAIREYRSGLVMQPGEINLLNSLGVALAEVNRHRQAIDCFAGVLKTDPDNLMALVNKGMSCRVLGRDDEAMASFEQVLQGNGASARFTLELCLQLSRLYCRKEIYDRAIELLSGWQIQKGVPKEFMFFRIMGEACMGAGQSRKAIEALQRSLQLHPRHAESMSMLGLLYVLEGEGDDIGLSLCDRAVAMDETDPEHLVRLATAQFHLGRYEQALSTVRAALAIRRNHVRAVLLRGKIYEGLGLMRRAGQSFQRVIDIKTSGKSLIREARDGLERVSSEKNHLPPQRGKKR